MSDTHRTHDLIVIGSGPGGASLAHRLAPSGKRILLIERGGYLPRTPTNWDAKAVFVDGVYQAPETWYDRTGDTFHPGLHYCVGGNSKVYGAALLRLRERDFGEVHHHGGLSPAWPLDYADFAPWYDEAERLFAVHGQRGEDPTEPPSTTPYPHPAITHDPIIESLGRTLESHGLHPFHLPLGIRMDEVDGRVTPTSPCIRCQYFDGFPCPLGAKADAQVMCVEPALAAHDNLELLTGAYVERLETDAGGRRVERVHVTRAGRRETHSAPIVVVACGALSSALLLLRSACHAHPDGLGNGSGLVGRNYLRHNQSVLMAVTRERNDATFQKTLAVADYYFESEAWDHPLGLVQMMAASHAAQIRGETLPGWLGWLPDRPFEIAAGHSLDFWMSSEDLPRPENRIRYDGKRVVLELEETNMEAHRRLVRRWKRDMDRADVKALMLERRLYFGKDIPIGGTAHQAGTAVFGRDPATSVLDADCRLHEVDNVYVADGSFFPSIGAVNPTLTIIANALRVAERVGTRL